MRAGRLRRGNGTDAEIGPYQRGRGTFTQVPNFIPRSRTGEQPILSCCPYEDKSALTGGAAVGRESGTPA